MVTISMYRGNLHRVPNIPREWKMPTRALSLPHFKLLLRRRSLALDRLASPHRIPSGDETTPEKARPSPSSPVPESIEQKDQGEDDCSGVSRREMDCAMKTSLSTTEIGGGYDPMIEPSKYLDIVNDKEEKRMELEKRLNILNKRKHELVQMLKQILAAEEEINRINNQQSSGGQDLPLQGEATTDTVSVTKHVPKLSVDVKTCNDLRGLKNTPNDDRCVSQMSMMPGQSPPAISMINRSSAPFLKKIN